MRALFAIGTRPEAIKLGPVIQQCRSRDEMEVVVVSTGQHRDLLEPALEIFDIAADIRLDVMVPNQTPTGVAARVLDGFEGVLADLAADWVVVQGDTTTVAAASLAAFYAGTRVAHVEAGLRTNDRRQPFPEEINRRLAAVVSSLHFAPTDAARTNLLGEGINEAEILVTGNTVIDALNTCATRPRTAAMDRIERAVGADREVVLLTAHRRETFGAPLESICRAVKTLAAEFADAVRFVYPVHPNPNVRRVVYEHLAGVSGVVLIEPVDYVTMVQLLKRSKVVLTDSGGLQEEAPAFSKPVLVLREVTERREGIIAGTAMLVGADELRIVDATARLLTDPAAYAAMTASRNPYGDGKASERIVAALLGEPVTPWQP